MTNDSYQTHPDIEDRFLQPKGWRWHMFAGHNGEKLRFGTTFPKHTIPKAVIVILPGLSEYCEKYFEVSNYFLEKKYAVYVLEWQGQGRSHRHYKKSPQKRVSNGFYRDVQDLDIFIRDYVLPSAVHPEVGRLPIAMLAHSMGANIGLRYLKSFQKTFACAGMTAPMFGIKALKMLPSFLRVPVAKAMAEIGDLSYAPGGTDYKPRKDVPKYKGRFSSDPVRGAVHDIWMEFDPHLKVGGVTYRWLYHAAKTCRIVRNKHFLNKIKTPLLFATAGKEKLVTNSTTVKMASQLEYVEHIHLEQSAHEILMEKDESRNEFLKAFEALVKRTILDKTDSTKPF